MFFRRKKYRQFLKEISLELQYNQNAGVGDEKTPFLLNKISEGMFSSFPLKEDLKNILKTIYIEGSSCNFCEKGSKYPPGRVKNMCKEAHRMINEVKK